MQNMELKISVMGNLEEDWQPSVDELRFLAPNLFDSCHHWCCIFHLLLNELTTVIESSTGMILLIGECRSFWLAVV